MTRLITAILAQTEPDAGAVDEAVPDGLTLGDWSVAVLIFVGAIALAMVLRRLVSRWIERRTRFPVAASATAALVSRVVGTVVVIAGFVYSLTAIGVQVGLFLGALGIGGIALAFAFQDILENFMAGFILQVTRPFRPRDYVEVGEVLSDPPARVLCSRLDDSAVVLTAYVWHDAFADVYWVQHRVIEEAKQALDDAGIEIPFPQRVLSLSPDSTGLDARRASEGRHRPGAATRA